MTKRPHDTGTLPEQSLDGAQRAPAPRVPALILLWCSQEPERAGQVCLLPAGSPGPARVFGRGPSEPRDAHARLLPLCQRPLEDTGGEPLANPYISRAQLVVRAAGHGVHVENVGKCKAFRNGEPFDSAVLEEGDLLQLGKQMLLLCTTRPVWLEAVSWPSMQPFGEPDSHGIIGEGPASWDLRRAIRTAAAQPSAHVLVLGSSGTGKELVAQAIHHTSARGTKPLISRNAATLPEGIVDAELFGNAKNYPNSGMAERPGLIGQADGSSLFLDEFAELPAAQQVHLLRVLDAGEYQRLGDSLTRRSAFRLIAATNRAPESLRHDMLARFKLRITLPDLIERPEDIPLLARHAWKVHAANNPQAQPLSVGFMAALMRQGFETNVRELERLVLRFITEPLVDWSDHVAASPTAADTVPPVDPAEISKELVEQSLTEHRWVQEKVWRALGLSSRHALARLVKKYGLKAPTS